ncbi:MAG: helix-turn-helix domain-containing protein [Pseudomonadota bacterium]
MRSGCPISYALEIFGDRWTLIVLRDTLLRSKRRFRELLACEEGIATNVLADRLKRLEQRGLLVKERDPADARQQLYRPTELAVSLMPMLVEMTVWGAQTSPDTEFDPDFLRRFKTDRAQLITDLQERVRAESGLD